MKKNFRKRWIRLWMRGAGLNYRGRLFTRIAAWAAPPYTSRFFMARLHSTGYIDPSAILHHKSLALGSYVFIADRVVLNQASGGGPMEIGDGTHILRDTIIATGRGGRVSIGRNTFIQPRCQIMGYVGGVRIGDGVQIAPNCGFYPYRHGIAPDLPIKDQPLESRGDIEIAEDAWLGYGVVVLENVRIGAGAVVGAGSVVTQDVPDGAIAAGNPARMMRYRGEASPDISEKQV